MFLNFEYERKSSLWLENIVLLLLITSSLMLISYFNNDDFEVLYFNSISPLYCTGLFWINWLSKVLKTWLLISMLLSENWLLSILSEIEYKFTLAFILLEKL